jgi:ABC-type antimicrobial peptide transport system permease subunit
LLCRSDCCPHGLFIGLIPTWQLSRQHPASTLHQGERTLGRGTGVLGKAPIISQIAISLILLQAAGLFLRTLQSLKSFDPGFEKVGLTEAHLTPLPQGYKTSRWGATAGSLPKLSLTCHPCGLPPSPAFRSATFSTFFAAIALLVAGFGLFGLMSYAVNLRTREIGIRMAMGSQRSGILGLILRESILVTLTGIAIGPPCALAASHTIAHMLFALSIADPLTLASASLTLLLTGTIAGLLPAIRAMNPHPMAALRHE